MKTRHHHHHHHHTFVPVGSVLAYAGRLASTDFSADDTGAKAMQQIRANLWTAGWLYCNGTVLSAIEYPDLFGTIAHAFGGSQDSFNLPDLRGQFIRGVSELASQDPDRVARLPTNRPGYDRWMVGSTQADAFQMHEHDYQASKMEGAAVPGEGLAVTLFQPQADVATTGCIAAPEGGTPRTSSETRPVNLYLNYIIRFRAEPGNAVGTVLDWFQPPQG